MTKIPSTKTEDVKERSDLPGSGALSGNRRPDVHPQGFALVVTLMLMILLSVIAVGMLSLSSIALRSGNTTTDQFKARANARLALMVAIGNLQEYAGPDQRVTAPAGLARDPLDPSKRFDTTNIHWTGVWSTTALGDPTKPMVGANTDLPAPEVGASPSLNALTDRRNIDATLTGNKWNNELRLGWLVSGNDPNPNNTAENTVKLVGSGTLGANPAAADEITVPKVPISTSATSGTTGAYAYWVGDESQKARIDQKATDKQPSLSNPTDGGMARLGGTEGPNFRFVKSGATPGLYEPIQDLAAKDRTNLVTPGTAAIPMNDTEALKKNYYDLTSYSRSVLADAREGGLQKDMTAYINSTAAAGIPAIANIPGSGLTHVASPYSSNPGISGRPMFPGTIYETYGPNFLQLRNWYDLRKKVTGGLSSKTIDPVFAPARSSASVYAPTYDYGPMPDIKAHAQPVQPYMTDCKIAWDYSINTSRGGGAAIRLHLYPRVTLWNPYNVKLSARTYLVGFLKCVGGFSSNVGAAAIRGTNGDIFGDGMSGPMVYFALNSPEMEPGECLVFSPATSSESVKYDPNDVTTNVLSSSVPSGGLSNFHIDTNTEFPSPATPPVQLNARYAIHTGENRQFVLKKAGRNSGISNADAQTGASHPIIQRLAMASCGENGVYYAGSPHGNWKVSESTRLLKTSGAHTGTVPSRHWSAQGRLQWMDECRWETIGGYNSATGDFPVRKPVIANFNIRPNIVHRSNFCTAYEQWYWQFGSYIESRAEQKPLNDPAFSGAYGNGKAYGSPFGYPADYSTVKSFVMFDVPAPETPLFSLANFQHVQLGYQGWQPTYPIGNSMCEPRCGSGAYNSSAYLPYLYRDFTVNEAYTFLGYQSPGWGGGVGTYKNAWDAQLEIDRNVYTGTWADLIQNTGTNTPMKELLVYDTSFMANHALWDRFFLSSIPYNSSGSPVWTDGTEVLPNTRMILNPYCPDTVAERTAKITGANTFDYSSYFLMNEGAFNINSISVEAWRAFFSSMNDVERPTNDNKTVLGAFSRLLTPNTSDPNGNHFAAGPWNSARVLTEAEIDKLAVAMVQAVKHRGPFLGLADFVNRRLLPLKGAGNIATAETDSPDASLCGPLQAAIETAGINSTLQNTTITSPSLGWIHNVAGGNTISRDARVGGWSIDNRSIFPDFWGFAPWKTFGLPGYVTQADILQSIGSNITARGDTFVIRGYGEAHDKNGKVTAEAWCEAVVQRTPDFVAGKSITDTSPGTTDGNNPLEPVVIRNAEDYTLAPNPNLHPLNVKFGRKFVISRFRWLTPSEI